MFYGLSRKTRCKWSFAWSKTLNLIVFLLLLLVVYNFSKRSAITTERDNRCSNAIEIGAVCAGINATRAFATLLKSILFHRTRPLHLHLIVDNRSSAILNTIFDTWQLPQVSVSFYHTERLVDRVKWIPNKHYSGVYGLMKLLFPDVLPASTRRVILVDVDVIFVDDVAKLWDLFGTFRGKQALGLVENQSRWYLGNLWPRYKPWPAIGPGFNTGVLMMDVGQLRTVKWSDLYERVVHKNLPEYNATSLADQDVINAVLKVRPDLLFRLPCEWNVQLGDKTLEDCWRSGRRPNVIHWNSPRKFEGKKYPRQFRRMYRTYLELNGDLLTTPIFGCGAEWAEIVDDDDDDECVSLRRVERKMWRTHTFIIDYAYESDGDDDVTLSTQLSMDRLQNIESLAYHWQGPISLALYLNDHEVEVLVSYVHSSKILQSRRNIAYHVVYKNGELYPINYLRNVALKSVHTPYVFLSDVDFLPMFGLYNYIKKSVRLMNNKQMALVIPAFETQRYKLTFPKSKRQLLHMIREGIIYTFRYQVWTRGHEPTNYFRWQNAKQPYEVHWQPDYEPYIVTRTDIPLYSTRFVGFGWNKVSHIMELHSAGYRFYVLPEPFLIHLAHAPSLDIVKFRHSSAYRTCLKHFKEDFIVYLERKYSRNVDNSTL